MTGADRAPAASGTTARAERCRGKEAGVDVEVDVDVVAEVAEHGCCPVEVAVVAAEGGVGEDAAPGLADERGADEAFRLVRGDAKEDLANGVVGQLSRRRREGTHGGSCGGRRTESEWVSIGARHRTGSSSLAPA